MKVSRIEHQENGKAISFALNNNKLLVIDIDLPSGKEQIILTADSTDLLRLMLYESHKGKNNKMPKAERSARNKALWALAKAEGKKKPDAVTTQKYELMTERIKVYEEEAESLIQPNEEDEFMKRFDEDLQRGIDEIFGN